jgi:hypothetical protein
MSVQNVLHAGRPWGRPSPLRQEPAGLAAHPTGLAALRARVRRIERRGAAAADRPRLALGAPALDARLPGGGLPLGALHEVEGLRGDWDDGAATGFCLAILARLLEMHDGPVLWVSPHGDLYGPGLAAQGLDPATRPAFASPARRARPSGSGPWRRGCASRASLRWWARWRRSPSGPAGACSWRRRKVG